MVRIAAAALAFAASLMAVSASANAPGHVATQNLNRRQEAESAPSDGVNQEENLEELMKEFIAIADDVKILAEEIMKHPDQVYCVTWAICGVRKLQENGILERFDTAGFADKVLEYGEARLALLNSDDPDIDADRFDIDRYNAHQGKIVDEPRDASSLPCKRAVVPCVAVNTNPKDAESKGPTVEKTQDGELIAEASKKSKESFNRLLEDYNFSTVAKQDKLIAGFTNKIAGGALAAAGLALYGKAVADVFSSNASILDKAAVVTSILPGIGCAVQLAADEAERGHASATHTALCFTQDALLVAAF
ncbi:hypothetical protein H634G_00875 [Metarhizium anisopliae BRIP 53293]|uniref:Uncharacterized protein n=1 Tax=Metarhizium anisopliae BRIP 53293 TaxID=1291518 RepID=A0A0D9PBJ1_METAN|nr:hypothetical protein H634G_00875 [Metarhizium anisopliae BRIP 53293]KJK92538.1 hypothetical protein H633G_03580 [Metarhizium anisopliae BRIP 53284]